MKPKTLIGAGMVVAMAALAMPAEGYAIHPAGAIQGDCFGALYVVEGASNHVDTRWRLFVGGRLVDDATGAAYSATGGGYYFRSIALFADGKLVAQFDGPWCV
jgi:hypothetical protein